MALVTVKSKLQVVIPIAIREQVRIGIGDIFEARIERGKNTLTPKAVVDRDMDQALAEMDSGKAKGRFHWPRH